MAINSILLCAGSIINFAWGAAHIAATRPVVAGFGLISQDNRRIITMEWVAEGLTHCFIGLLVLFLTLWSGYQDPVALAVYRAAAVMLVVVAALTAMTGARTSTVPVKICPFVLTAVAVLFGLGSIL